MDYELNNERETLAMVARILRGEAEPLRLGDETIRYHQGEYCGYLEYEGFCGTAACIGGHAWLIENPGDAYGARIHVSRYEDTGKLHKLYWGAFSATPAQGAAAIENYLADGKPRWWQVKNTVPAVSPQEDASK